MSFELERYLLSVFFQSYFPGMIMVILGGLSMFLDAKSVPARVSMGKRWHKSRMSLWIFPSRRDDGIDDVDDYPGIKEFVASSFLLNSFGHLSLGLFPICIRSCTWIRCTQYNGQATSKRFIQGDSTGWHTNVISIYHFHKHILYILLFIQ